MTTKEEDAIDQLIPASTHDYLLFFTNKGRVFRLKAYEVPAASLQAKGVAAVNLLQLQPEEKITSIIKHEKDASDDGYLFMTTTKGTVKKTPLKDYANIRTNGLIAIKLDEGFDGSRRLRGRVILSSQLPQGRQFDSMSLTHDLWVDPRGALGVFACDQMTGLSGWTSSVVTSVSCLLYRKMATERLPRSLTSQVTRGAVLVLRLLS
jgi:hypothetical protein